MIIGALNCVIWRIGRWLCVHKKATFLKKTSPLHYIGYDIKYHIHYLCRA